MKVMLFFVSVTLLRLVGVCPNAHAEKTLSVSSPRGSELDSAGATERIAVSKQGDKDQSGKNAGKDKLAQGGGQGGGHDDDDDDDGKPHSPKK
jgi:hypothetical protein